MKKLFTLLTLALISIGSAWGQDDPTPTYKSTWTDNTAIWLTKADVDGFADTEATEFWMVKGGAIGTKELSKDIKYIDPATNEVSETAQFSSKPTFYVEKQYNATLSSDKSLYIYVTGVAKMYFYTWCNSNPDGRYFEIFVNDSKKGEISYASGVGKAQFTSVVLDKTANNIIRVSASNEVMLVAIKPILNVTAESFQGVKIGDETLDPSTGFVVDDVNRIVTLTSSYKMASAPTNLKLIKRMTFSDSSTSDEDVDVTFNTTAEGGYFTSASTVAIGSNNYTVKIPQDVTPTLTLDETSGDITLKSYEAIAPITVKLSGGNLTDGTYDAPTATGITVIPTTFTVSGGTLTDEVFTITPSASAAASTVLTFTVGTATADYTLNFSQPAQGTATEVTEVSSATTWDWTKAGNGVTEVKLTDTTNPTRTTEFILSNLPEINNDANFNSGALKVKGEYMLRGNEYFQGGYITLKTTVPGTIAVTFTNTGSSNDDRCLTVDGTAYTDVKAGKQSGNDQVTKSVAIAAGEHTLSGMIVETNSAQYLRFYKIVFTPLADLVTMNEYEWATYVSDKALDFTGSNVKAYIVTGHSGSAITKSDALTTVPANTPLLLNAPEGNYAIPHVASSSTDVSANLLVAGDGSEINPSATQTAYVLSAEGGAAKFMKVGNSIKPTVPTGKAYLLFKEVIGGAREFLDIDIDGVSTGIKNMKVGSEDNVYYDLQGRRVLYPTKGLYIVNGKKVVIK
jgi:hypothetical protein